MFLFGANYPWYNGYRGVDIGRLAPHKEIVGYTYPAADGKTMFTFPSISPGGTGFDAAAIEKQFQDMHGIGIRVVRWFWGFDGRSFFELDDEGACTGLAKDVFVHLDSVLDIARRHQVYLVPVLLDFRFVSGDAPQTPARRLRYKDGRPEPPHANVIKDGAKRRRLIENGITPLVRRYADSKQILIWEIMNEAGNVTHGRDPVTGYVERGIGKRLLAENQRVSVEELQRFFNEVYDAIKSVDRNHYVLPSGLARTSGLPLVVGRVKADLYGAHYSDKGVPDYGKAMSVAEIQAKILAPYKLVLDRPLLMTEATPRVKRHLPYYVDIAFKGGWAGILVWDYHELIGYSPFNTYKETVTSQDGRGSDNVAYFRKWQSSHSAETEFPKGN